MLAVRQCHAACLYVMLLMLCHGKDFLKQKGGDQTKSAEVT